MGQYFLIANLDRKEYLSPDGFGEGPKLMEFGAGAGGTMAGLAILLAVNDGHRFPLDGGTPHPIIGRWGGQRIAAIDDYLEPEDAPHIEVPGEQGNHYYNILEQRDGWVDISEHVVATLETTYRHGGIRARRARDELMVNHRSMLHADGTITAVTVPEMKDRTE